MAGENKKRKAKNHKREKESVCCFHCYDFLLFVFGPKDLYPELLKIAFEMES